MTAQAVSWHRTVSSSQHGKKYSLFLQLSPWWSPCLRRFAGHAFGTSRKKAPTFSMTQPQHTEQGSCPEAWLPDSSFRPHPLQPFRQQGELRQEPQRIAIPLQRLPSCHPPTPTKQSPPPHKNPPERTSLRRVTSLNRENRQQGFNKHESLWRGKGGVWGGEGEPFSRKVPLPLPNL